MSDQARIALNVQTSAYHALKLTRAHEGISPGSDVRRDLEGNGGGKGGDASEASFHSWMEQSAAALGRAADRLRKDLAQNAEALRAAAIELAERNEISDDESKRFLALLDDSASTGSAKSSGAAPSAGTGQAGGSGSSADAGSVGSSGSSYADATAGSKS